MVYHQARKTVGFSVNQPAGALLTREVPGAPSNRLVHSGTKKGGVYGLVFLEGPDPDTDLRMRRISSQTEEVSLAGEDLNGFTETRISFHASDRA